MNTVGNNFVEHLYQINIRFVDVLNVKSRPLCINSIAARENIKVPVRLYKTLKLIF